MPIMPASTANCTNCVSRPGTAVRADDAHAVLARTLDRELHRALAHQPSDRARAAAHDRRRAALAHDLDRRREIERAGTRETDVRGRVDDATRVVALQRLVELAVEQERARPSGDAPAASYAA